MSFKKLEGDTCVLRHGGVFKVADLYTWRGGLFAKLGAGYVQLRRTGGTTKDGVDFVHLEIDAPLFADKFDRVVLEGKQGYRSLSLTVDPQGATLLLEAPTSVPPI